MLLAACGGDSGVDDGGTTTATHSKTWVHCDDGQNTDFAAGQVLESVSFQSDVLAANFTIHFYVPANYATADIRYPAIYMLDGKWHFEGIITWEAAEPWPWRSTTATPPAARPPWLSC